MVERSEGGVLKHYFDESMMAGQMDEAMVVSDPEMCAGNSSSTEEEGETDDSGTEESTGASVEEHFSLFNNQVSGHMPLISCGRGKIGKPAMPQEVEFYEAILAVCPRLKAFIPTYLGCVDLSLQEIVAMGDASLSLDADADDDSDEQQCGSLGDADSVWGLDMEGLPGGRRGSTTASRNRRRRKASGRDTAEGSENALKAKMFSKFIKRYSSELSGKWEGSMGARSVRFLMLEDLTFPFREGRPCVLDVKMGTRQYRANATPEKEQRQRYKSRSTTTAQYGLRLNGMQVWQQTAEVYASYDKYWGRSVQGDTLQAAVTKFFHNGDCLRVDVIPPLLLLLEELASVIKSCPHCRFYSSSLLLIYDGAGGVRCGLQPESSGASTAGAAAAAAVAPGTHTEPASSSRASVHSVSAGTPAGTSPRKASDAPQVDVRLIDFANSLCTSSSSSTNSSSAALSSKGYGGCSGASYDSGMDAIHPEDGCLLGLRNIIALLSDIYKAGSSPASDSTAAAAAAAGAP